MSYRNDHDAALARVDALETELEQMAGEYERTRAALAAKDTAVAPRPRKAGAITAVFLAAVASVGAGLGMAMLRTPSEPEVPVAVAAADPDDSSALTSDLEMCLAGVEASMHTSTRFDAETTDPRGSLGRSPQPIIAIGAGCRPELDRVAADTKLDAPTRALLGRWIAREDELAGAISRITVYYGNDPYALDGYATAGQLWRELDRARESRDALIEAERAALRGAVVD
jgi:hypothetical protein